MEEDQRKSLYAYCAKTKVYLMASTKNALAMCDTCGFVYPHRVMQNEQLWDAGMSRRL